MSKFEIYHNYLNYLLLLHSLNEHKYISDVMILSGWKHFSIRSSHTMSRVDQFIIATNGNIQMKNISCLSHFPIKWCLCLWTFFENYLPGKPDLITGESCTRLEGNGQQWWTIESMISMRGWEGLVYLLCSLIKFWRKMWSEWWLPEVV